MILGTNAAGEAFLGAALCFIAAAGLVICISYEIHDQLKAEIARLTAERDRLRAIEAAAQRWRASLEEDGWTEDDILSGICRDGMADLMRLLRSHEQQAPEG